MNVDVIHDGNHWNIWLRTSHKAEVLERGLESFSDACERAYRIAEWKSEGGAICATPTVLFPNGNRMNIFLPWEVKS